MTLNKESENQVNLELEKQYKSVQEMVQQKVCDRIVEVQGKCERVFTLTQTGDCEADLAEFRRKTLEATGHEANLKKMLNTGNLTQEFANLREEDDLEQLYADEQ